MLKIEKPYIEHVNGKVRLCAKLIFPNVEKTAWFEVEQEYEKYLTTDRADAFVVAFVTAAMKAGEDIVSEAPVTKRLLYQLNTQLIPMLATHTKRYNRMRILAETTEDLIPCENAIGLGWTGGVDSFYSFKRYAEATEPMQKITHLVVLNIGTFQGARAEAILPIFVKRAKEMADAHGIKAFGINSNIHLIINENYLSVGAFRIPSAILAFQKLFGAFLHSSSYEYWRFAFKEENSAFYELFVFDCLETDNTRFYSTTGDASRIEKITALADYAPAWTRLHPCLYSRDKNCGICGKCDSVFTTLYALDKLDNFASVVDVELVKAHLEGFIDDIAVNVNGVYKGELYRFLEKKGMITPRHRRIARVMKVASSEVSNNKEPKQP